MRITRKKNSLGDSEMSKGMTRSSSNSSQYLKDSKNQIFHKKNKTPKPNEIQEFSLEKHSSTEIFTMQVLFSS